MKVLLVVNSLNVGGAENLICESLPFYKKCQVDLAVLTRKNDILTEKAKSNSKGDIFFLAEGSVYNPLVIIKLISLIKKYETIHVHLFPSLYFVVIAGLFCNKKINLVYTEHSTNNKRRSNFVFRFFDKLIYNRINKIVTIATDVDLELKSHLGGKFLDKFVLIENGINLEKFISANAYPKDQFFEDLDSKIIIQVSSFRFPKDQPTLIRSLKLLPNNYKLILVGSGPLIEENIQLVNSLGLNSRVKFLGLRSDIPNLLKTSDVIVLSSKYEGLSLSSIEGMVVGKPFIASNVKGLREIVEGNGLLFSFGNAEELSDKIRIAVEDNEQRQIIISRCYNKALQYDIKYMIDKYEKVY
ncbi:MAG: glycosyltransferase [Sphingobacterium sp.]|jgi:glycosyltransferase involved in cell wall biosynthesis|uniref:glycosyltransferase n=1 Tax=Sphingobacterium sp. TaxID=341027 RepID=UPI002841D301|nr:glycosyltransferase [Sphingobacterium sp.]MDR3011472.1 glycosyltransferase [Sphingobacterium sp.]